jgi:MFS transporter, OFA family, oxalate/formate antiporter
MSATTTTPDTRMPSGRWAQLWLGVLCMMLIANLQYSWTLFVDPLRQANHWALADIQWAFTIFIALETWVTPFCGYAVDRMDPHIGPRLMILLGGIGVGCGWVLNSRASTLTELYVAATVSGLGAGGIYATCVGNAVKWFPDRRGLAVGLTAAGFGAGAALTVVPIRMVIAQRGYQDAFLYFGAGQGALLILIASVIVGPKRALTASASVAKRLSQSARSFTSVEMLTSPIFWLMYLMFVANASTGLMAAAQLAPIAKDFGISNTELVFGATVLSVALVVDNVLNGMARPFFGWVSDLIGRELTMGIAFALGAASYGALAFIGHDPWAFVVCAGMIFFTWGEIFSLFPSLCTDMFGPKYAAANASFLYTAKGTAALLVPFANVVALKYGGWGMVFTIAAVSNLIVATLAVAVLRPWRIAFMRMGAARMEAEAAAAEPAKPAEPLFQDRPAAPPAAPLDPSVETAARAAKAAMAATGLRTEAKI